MTEITDSFKQNCDYLLETGVEAETWWFAGNQLAIHVPQNEEALIGALVYRLRQSANALYDQGAYPDRLEDFLPRFEPAPQQFRSEWRPARANMAVRLDRFRTFDKSRQYLGDTHYSIFVDIRNDFEDKAKALKDAGESNLRYSSRPSQIFVRMLETINLESAVNEVRSASDLK